jgi:citrate lyase alpha subunit
VPWLAFQDSIASGVAKGSCDEEVGITSKTGRVHSVATNGYLHLDRARRSK